MGQKTLTIYDVPEDVRRKGAAAAKASIVQALSQPVSREFREELMERLAWVAKVESLDVAGVVTPPPPLREPVHHEIEVVEQVTSDEGVA
jgi:hypothetical protein